MTLPHGIDSKILEKRYEYQEHSGEFVWRESFDFLYGSGKKKGDTAGKWRGNDYVLSVNGHELPGRKLAWWFMTGEWPVFRIGVKDGNYHNLAWNNLGVHSEILRARRTCICVICGNAYESSNPKKQKTCSYACAAKLRVPRPDACMDCGLPFGDATRRRCQSCRSWLARKRLLAKKYGLTPDNFQALVDAQGGCCAICGEAPESGPVVDHDHKTGAIRGILCGPCNMGLGMFKDLPSRLESAIGYLTQRAGTP